LDALSPPGIWGERENHDIREAAAKFKTDEGLPALPT